MKLYKLLKDLPTFNAGDIFEIREDGCLYYQDPLGFQCWEIISGHRKKRIMAYHKKTLERFPNILKDWFEEIIEDDGDTFGQVLESFIEYAEEAEDSFYCDESVRKEIEKFKAWKRLRENGFRFAGIKQGIARGVIKYKTSVESAEVVGELRLLFGGEDEK